MSLNEEMVCYAWKPHLTCLPTVFVMPAQALECRKQSDMEMYMNKGLAVADSEPAKAKLVR